MNIYPPFLKLLSEILKSENLFVCEGQARKLSIGAEVNPESWTQLKGSNEKRI